MVKTVATPTAQARKSTATTPTSSSAAKTTVRSSLPTRRTSPNPPARTAAPPLSIDGRPRRPEGTRIPQSPGKRRRAK
ncbi:hypothetical protein M3Y99_00074500 [Aphelenchoides fujianensis]|nr:hypothetical protein M3Y99_00074500 [Aphelenchoides fujianensis]